MTHLAVIFRRYWCIWELLSKEAFAIDEGSRVI